MAKKALAADRQKIGHYAFIAGIVVAIIVALIPQIRGDPSTWVLVILGVIVGWVNIKAKEITEFLVAALVLLISFGMTALTLASLHTTLGVMWGNVITFVAPAAIIVAIKAVYVLAEK
ncbi:hypothetical protein KY343_02885 [Candidatus Woesearchaeota archaeon]|nr:hypothetical protein [Candidatus Woesearchaeota archaeon]